MSQEDSSIEDFKKITDFLPAGFRFALLADLNYGQTRPYARTTTYLLDKTGHVLQVFPMETYHRASWWAVLGEFDRLVRLTGS